MSFLSRLFGGEGASAKPDPKLMERLERMEAEAANAPPAYVGSTYNRAGDLALRAEDADRAVKLYGRAIDAFLEDGQREPARGVANKIIRVRPRAVRTLCTLIWLDLAARHTATAILHLRDYVEAAKDVDEGALAADQLGAMARIVPESEFLEAVADALDGLAFARRATEVRAWAGQGGAPSAAHHTEELEALCLKAAVRSNVGGRSGPSSDAR